METPAQPRREMFLTVTLNPRWYNRGTKQQYLESIFILHKYLRQFASDYQAYPELTKRGNIHYHIMYTEKDRIKRYKLLKTMVDQLGDVDFQVPRILINAIEYCQKDRKLMEEVLGVKLPITFADMESARSSLKVNVKNTPYREDLMDQITHIKVHPTLDEFYPL